MPNPRDLEHGLLQGPPFREFCEGYVKVLSEQVEKAEEAHGKLRLYVWRLSAVHRKATVAFAMAHTTAEARRLILANLPKWLSKQRDVIERSLQGNPEVYSEPHGLCL